MRARGERDNESEELDPTREQIMVQGSHGNDQIMSPEDRPWQPLKRDDDITSRGLAIFSTTYWQSLIEFANGRLRIIADKKEAQLYSEWKSSLGHED